MHEHFICFSHSCPFQGKELDKEGIRGEPWSQALALLISLLLLSSPESSSWSASCLADGSAADTQLGWFNPQSVCVCVWQPRQEARKLFSLGSASVVSPKAVVELLCCLWSHYAMKWSLDEGQMYYLGRNSGSSKECSVIACANKWNCFPVFCLCRDYFYII